MNLRFVWKLVRYLVFTHYRISWWSPGLESPKGSLSHIFSSWCWILGPIWSWSLVWNTPMWPLYVVWALYKYCGWFQGQGGGGRREREDEREGNIERTVSDDSLAGMHHYLPWLLFIEAFTKSLPSSKSIDFPSWWGNVVPYNVVEEQWDWKYCCGCLGGCILPHSCLWFPSFPEPAPSPSSPLSWHLLVSFLHTLLIWLRFTGRMGVNVVLFYIFMFKQTKWSKWQHQLDNPGGKCQSQEKCLQSLGLPDFLLCKFFKNICANVYSYRVSPYVCLTKVQSTSYIW